MRKPQDLIQWSILLKMNQSAWRGVTTHGMFRQQGRLSKENPIWYLLYCSFVWGCLYTYSQKSYPISKLSGSRMFHTSTWKYLVRQVNCLGVHFTWSMLGGFWQNWESVRPGTFVKVQRMPGFGHLPWLRSPWANLHQLGHHPKVKLCHNKWAKSG